jgi:hypothetical protein
MEPRSMWLFRNNYVNSLCKFQYITEIILKLSKFLNPKPERLINFNLLLMPSTIPLVVL